MRDRVLFAIACVLALGAAFYLLVLESGSEDGAGSDPGVADEGGGGDLERAPSLLGAGDGRVHVPREIRGRGSLQGTVRRRGDPIPATVELRHVAEMDPSKPYLGGMSQMMIERMLDAGISRKEVIAHKSAGEDGAFHFGGLAPGLYEVRATAENGAVGFASAMLPAEGARVEASIEVADGDERLEGRVVYANGTPFQGLVVVATGEGFAMMMGGVGNIMPTSTDEHGYFVIGGLSPGRVRVSAILPGVLRMMGPPVALPHSGGYVLTIDAAGVEVKGRVISAATQEPIAGATVFGGGGDGNTHFTIRTTLSAEDGTFSLTIPAGRGGGMFVKADGYAPSMVEFRGAGGKDVTVSLQKLGTVRGVVRAKRDGRPLPGVGVYALPQSRREAAASAATTFSGADGRYELGDVAPGSVKIIAVGAGWVTEGVKSLGAGYSPFAVSLEPGGEVELDLELVPGARASGVVKTSSGEPVRGAVVKPVQGEMSGMMVRAMSGMGNAFGASVSDADGRYTVDTLFPSAQYTLHATAPGLPDAKSERFQAKGGETYEVDLVFAAARWVHVRVVAAEGGTAIAGAQVRVVPADAPVQFDDFFGVSTWTTASDGRVKVGPIPPGDSKVLAKAEGYIDANKEIDASGQGDVELAVEMRKGLVIAGRVELPPGVPVQSIRVRVSTSHHVGGRRDWFNERVGVAADGTFRVTTIKDPGAYSVSASAEWEQKRYRGEITVDAGADDIVLKLVRDAEQEKKLIAVKVLGADGEPLAAARIQLYEFRGGRGSSSSRRHVSQGKAEFEVSDPDSELWVEVWELADPSSGATIQGPFAGDGSEIEVRLAAPKAIEGRVVGPDGNGVRAVRVTANAVHPSERENRGRDHAVGFSDAEGAFALKGLGELEYRLTFEVPPDFAPVLAQDAQAGTRGIRVALRKGLGATLTVLDYDGKPVLGASAYLNPVENGTKVPIAVGRGNDRSDSAGVIRLRGLAPDAVFKLRVSPPQDRSDLRHHENKAWVPADHAVTLERAYVITGTVRDTHGKPVTDCWVTHRPAGGDRWKGSAQTDAQGAFEIKQLTAGRYDLRVHLRGSSRSEAVATTARAGATGVRLTVDLGATLAVQVADWDRWRRAGIGRLQASLRSETERPTHIQGYVDHTGRLQFRGLVAGTRYALWIGGLPDGHYVHRTGLQAGNNVVTVEAKLGGQIQGRVVIPAGAKLRWVGISASNAQGLNVSGAVDSKTGRFVLPGLPEGEWTLHVHAWGEDNKQQYGAQASARPGAEIEIELKAK